MNHPIAHPASAQALPLRIIDANANRAAEGLRVMEDLARFALDHADLAEGCKRARHTMQKALEALPGGRLALLAARDTPGDVGTAITAVGSETRRESLASIAAAGASRSAQALRMIEEASKLASPALASVIEGVRYSVYELEKRLGLALGTGRATQWRVCVLLTESMCRRPWLEVAAESLKGGADCLQLREKNLGDAKVLDRARQLVSLTHDHASQTGAQRATVIVNDRADLALLAHADGVHLGQGDLSVAEARALAGERLLIGVSTHDTDEARRAIHDGADYAGVGAMFATGTKPRSVSGPAYLAAFLSLTSQTRPIPHLAIGGINPVNAAALVAVGCQGVALSSSVCGSDDPAGVCRAVREALGDTPACAGRTTLGNAR